MLEVPEVPVPGVVQLGLQPTQVTGAPARMYEASPSSVERREAPHTEGATAASLPDIRVLLEQALAKGRQEAAGRWSLRRKEWSPLATVALAC